MRCTSDEPDLADDALPVAAALEAAAPLVLGGASWAEAVAGPVLRVLEAHRPYRYSSVRDLLRAVRNCDHVQAMPDDAQALLLPRPAGVARFFLPRFPALVWVAYCAVREHWRERTVFEPFFATQAHATTSDLGATHDGGGGGDDKRGR